MWILGIRLLERKRKRDEMQTLCPKIDPRIPLTVTCKWEATPEHWAWPGVAPLPTSAPWAGTPPAQPQPKGLPLPSSLIARRTRGALGSGAGGRDWRPPSLAGRHEQEHEKFSQPILFPTGVCTRAAQDVGDTVAAVQELTIFLKRLVLSGKQHSLGQGMSRGGGMSNSVDLEPQWGHLWGVC